MGNQITEYSAELYDYRISVSSRLSDAWQGLAAETDHLHQAQMRSSEDIALLLQTLAKSVKAEVVVDVGTFTGCSALALAEAVGANGKVLTYDISDQHLAMAQKYWDAAGVADVIEFTKSDATAALKQLAKSTSNSVDLIFMDANKKAYSDVFELAIRLVKPGGYIIVDDTLWAGKIVESDSDIRQVPALREFNESVSRDARVQAVVLPIGNGLTIALKL